MDNIYSKLRELARSIRAQNLFVAAKDLSGIRIFKNTHDFSKLQEIYLTYLYNSNAISNDIILEKISKHVFDSEIYEDSYLLWKQKNMRKINIKDNEQKDVHLVTGKHIKFPKKV